MNIFNRFSVRTRLVCITVIILTLCCIGLTAIINYSAIQMTSEVAQTLTPAQSIEDIGNQIEFQQPAMGIGESQENREGQQQIIHIFYRNSFLYMIFIIIIGGVMTVSYTHLTLPTTSRV